jgi:hypothetical protein
MADSPTVGFAVKFEASGPIFDRNLKKLVAKASREAITHVALSMEGDIKRGLVPSPRRNVIGGRKTGHLSRGIRAKVHDDFTADVRPGKWVYGADVPYAPIVESGRSASSRVIVPRRAKALRFKPRGSGKYVYRAWTRPYLKPLKGTHIFARTQKKWDGDRANGVFHDKLRDALRGAHL